jgi:imidazoleglycerol-phosphate dehydratase
LVLKAQWPQDRSGNFDIFLLKEFFQAFVNKAELNAHLECRYGENSHHMAESLFKALGKALFQATRPRPEGWGVASTKGQL